MHLQQHCILTKMVGPGQKITETLHKAFPHVGALALASWGMQTKVRLSFGSSAQIPCYTTFMLCRLMLQACGCCSPRSVSAHTCLGWYGLQGKVAAIGHCTPQPWGSQPRVPLCQDGDDVMKVRVPAGFSGADACVGLIQQHLAQQVQSSRAQVGRQVLQQMSCSQAELEAACACTMHAAHEASERAPWLSWQD